MTKDDLINKLMILISVTNFLRHLYNICDPQDKTVYIFIDGCTSLNKLNEQKKRKIFGTLYSVNNDPSG